MVVDQASFVLNCKIVPFSPLFCLELVGARQIAGKTGFC